MQDISKLVEKWKQAVVGLATAHDKDAADRYEAGIEECLGPVLTMPVRQIRELAVALLVALKSDPTVPFLVWRAHGAAADAEATADVLAGQLAAYPDLAEMNLDDLAAFSRQNEHRMADIAGKLYFDVDGQLRYAFGKHKDALVVEQTNYANWILRCTDPPFPGSTCELLRKALGYPDDEEEDDLPEAELPFDTDGDRMDYTPGGSPIFMNPPKRT